ncbi:MAG TPA: pitrilysin family protein [Candidatus Dormibacteraeota bacterium]|nr:pitrilysin family protein [Candidatus Dormibacteraeota bacterium]
MPLSLPFTERTLANGLRLIVSEDATTPNVAVCLWYGVGSRHERPGKTGFAHLFEHVMFQGSTNVAKGEHFSLIQAAGGTLNGTTSFDRTNYFETMPSHQLALAMWLEADRMGGLLDALDQENLDNQRDVVKNERRQSYDNQPYGTAYERLFAMLFPPGHQYHHLPIGSMEDLDAASLEDVRGFFSAHYAPDNCVLAVVGDAAEREVVDLAERYFGAIPARRERSGAPDGTIGPLEASVRDEVHDEDVPAERYTAAYRIPVDGSPDVEALSVAASVLSRGQASRLERRLVRRDQLAQEVSVGVERLVGGASIAYVDVLARSGVALGDVETALEEEIALLAATPPSAAEIERAQALQERSWLDQLTGVQGRADQLCRFASLHGDPRLLLGVVDRALQVPADAVSDAVARLLRPSAKAVLTYHLESPKQAAA